MSTPRGRHGAAGHFWWRVRGVARRTRERIISAIPTKPERIVLDDVRRRLELTLSALYGRAMHIHVAPDSESSTWDRLTRLTTPRHLRTSPLSWTDGHAILLPAALDYRRGDTAGLSQYRLLALVQAERIARGTALLLPSIDTPLERDLFLLRESMAVEARLARDVGSATEPLADARAAALHARPAIRGLRETERQVEAIIRTALGAHPGMTDETLANSTPADSLAWARATSRTMRGSYRGVAPVMHWGGVQSPPDAASAQSAPQFGNPDADRDGIYQFEARTVDRAGEGAESEHADAERDGDAIEDDRGAVTETTDLTASGDDDAAPASPSQMDATAQRDPDAVPDDPGPGVTYPEWDYHSTSYRGKTTTVRERLAAEASGAWADEALLEHAPIVRRIRERFEPLRAQRLRLTQQRDGEELDLQACVQAMVDVRTGHTPSDRIYTSVRPARRALTIGLLVDVSGSTEAPLASGQRIVDIARQAVLLASEAFDVLGDPYALLTFSSRGSRNVRVGTVKDFPEHNGTAVRQRIAGIEPGGNTRLGSAIRHASARLTQQPLGRRLLLILSDGRPNDFDDYYETAGVEDSRQAVNEARALGIFPYCITIDREDGPEYLPRIFGPTGYTVLRTPEQLPLALVRVVRGLLAR